MHADSADGHAMLAAEESISTRLDRDGAYRRALAGALRESDEFASCRNERISDNDALAMALVNAALSVAEAMWDEAPGVSGDTADVALWQSRIDAQAAEIDTAIRDGMTAQSEFITRAQTLADEMGEPVGRLVADLRQAFIRLTGQTPEEAEAARDWPERVDEDVSVFGVAVLAWVPATSGVDLPDGRSGEIEADVLCHETLQVEACDEADAMVRARRRLEAEYLYDIWEPCPGRGIRDAHWVGDLADDEALDDPSRVVDLAKEAWVYRYEDASGFVADQVVDKPA